MKIINKEIKMQIDNFFKKYGNSKIKKVNNRCAKKKAKCPYTISGRCRGYCLV